jgi:hypothetical protein
MYLLTEKALTELRNKAAAVSDGEEDEIYEIDDDERPLNVFDQVLDKYID